MSISKINEYMKLADGWTIFRRYLVMNAFDGILTVLGVTLGAFLLGITDPRQVFLSGLSAAIAIGVSGIYIAYLTEQAEQRKDQIELEKKLLKGLDDTKYARANNVANIINSGINGFSPFFFGFLTLTPFLLPFPSIEIAYFTSFTLNFIILFILGMFLGRIAEASMVGFGIRTIIAGILVIILIFITNL